jgi:cyclase
MQQKKAMSSVVRIIPRLDIKGPNLVKGIHLEGLRVLGKPWDFAYKYYIEGADELIYIDAVASLYGRNNLSNIVERTANNIFIPLTVGGGIRSCDDIYRILRAGADKVAINTAAVLNPQLLYEGARNFGSQCIVLSIQAKRIDEHFMCMTDNARETSSRKVNDWARQAVDLGAGEILITAVDNEGTGHGYDNDLTADLASSLPVPVIVCGGCGCMEHIAHAIHRGKADAVAVSSLFHYKYLEQRVNIGDFLDEGNIEFINRKRGNASFMSGRLKLASIKETKHYLEMCGISCRMIQ